MEPDYSTSKPGMVFAVINRSLYCRTLTYPTRVRLGELTIDDLKAGDHFLDYEYSRRKDELEPVWYSYDGDHWNRVRATGCSECRTGYDAMKSYHSHAPVELDSLFVGNVRVSVYSDGRIVRHELADA